MTEETSDPKAIKPLISKALKVLQDSSIIQKPESLELFSTILRNINFFQKKLSGEININEFIEAIKFHLKYEVCSYGTILQKEKDRAHRFCIILKGSVKKLQRTTEGNVLRRSTRMVHAKTTIGDQPSELNPYRTSYVSGNKNLWGVHTQPIEKQAKLTPRSLLKLKSIELEDEPVRRSKFRTIIPNTVTNIEQRSPRTKRMGMLVQFDDSLEEMDVVANRSPISVLDKNLSPISLKVDSVRLPDRLMTSSRGMGNNSINSAFLKGLNFSNTDIEEEEGQDMQVSLIRESDREDEPYIIKEDQAHFKFIKDLAQRNREIQHRLISDGSTMVSCVGILKRGEYFGENFYKENQAKESHMMAVSSQEVHMLTIGREAYQKVVAELLKEATTRINIFKDVFQSFDESLVQSFSFHFNQKAFKKGEVIYHQNDPSERLYLLEVGNVLLLKDLRDQNQSSIQTPMEFSDYGVRKNDMKNVPIANIVSKQFFGEEMLINKETREHKAIATNDCVACFLELNEYEKLKDEFEVLLKNLKRQTKKRFAWREERALNIASQQQKLSKTISIGFNNSQKPRIHTTRMTERAPNPKLALNLSPKDCITCCKGYPEDQRE